VITIEEQTWGWLGLIRCYPDVHQPVAYSELLISFFAFFTEWQILSFGSPAADEFKRLRQQGVLARQTNPNRYTWCSNKKMDLEPVLLREKYWMLPCARCGAYWDE
jgi:hypothetical protein